MTDDTTVTLNDRREERTSVRVVIINSSML